MSSEPDPAEALVTERDLGRCLARAAASSPASAVTKARPASRAAVVTAYEPAWTRANDITR